MPTSPPPRLPAAQLADAAVERMRDFLHRAMQSAADHLVLAAMRRGNPRAIVVAEDEYEAFIATLELEEDKEAQDDIRAGLEETRQGLPPTWAEFKAELQGHGSGETDKAF